MSRFEKYDHESKKACAYGHDHACGYFIQIWSTQNYTDPDPDNIIVDKDSLFHGVRPQDVVEIARVHGFEIHFGGN